MQYELTDQWVGLLSDHDLTWPAFSSNKGHTTVNHHAFESSNLRSLSETSDT
jgi:hypothetical protein